MKTLLISILLLLIYTLTFWSQQNPNRQTEYQDEPVIQDSCDDIDAPIDCCFQYMPRKLTHKMVIAGPSEPGERLIITGKIFKSDGKTPYPDVILYAYHADTSGNYIPSENAKGVHQWHGRLYGWCKTNKNGEYEIHTIRPARYPDQTMPAHIHIVVKEPKNIPPYYITDTVFRDDDLVNYQYLLSIDGVGGSGIVDLTKDKNNVWRGKRDIILEE